MSIEGKGLILRSGLGEDDDDDVLVVSDKVVGSPGLQQQSYSSLDDLFHRLNVPLWYVILGLAVIH